MAPAAACSDTGYARPRARAVPTTTAAKPTTTLPNRFANMSELSPRSHKVKASFSNVENVVYPQKAGDDQEPDVGMGHPASEKDRQKPNKKRA